MYDFENELAVAQFDYYTNANKLVVHQLKNLGVPTADQVLLDAVLDFVKRKVNCGVTSDTVKRTVKQIESEIGDGKLEGMTDEQLLTFVLRVDVL